MKQKAGSKNEPQPISLHKSKRKWFDKIFCGYENEKINFDVPHLEWQVIHISIQPFSPGNRDSLVTLQEQLYFYRIRVSRD